MEEFDSDRSEVIQRAKQIGVEHILLPNVDLGSIQKMYELASLDKHFFKIMAGIHPCYVQPDMKKQLSVIEDLIKGGDCIAVGEIGIDLYWDLSTKELQQEMLRSQMDIAKKYKLPVVLHTREAFEETLEIVKDFPEVSGVFHCFTGTFDQAQRAIEAGYFLGVGGVVTYKKSGLDTILAKLGLKNIVIETDAPYLSPVPQRGKRNEPYFLKYIVEHLADICQMKSSDVIEETDKNAKLLFKL